MLREPVPAQAFTTVWDIDAFWHALFSDQLLPSEQIKMMTSPHVPSGDYGLGVWLKEHKNRVIPAIEGCDPGVSFMSSYDPASDRMIALVSNYGDDVWAIYDAIIDAWMG